MKKLILLAAAATGYVLGSRAGRERYEQIRTQATKAWNNPTVQSAVDDVQTQAKQAGADVSSKVGHKVAGAASDATSKLADRLSSADADPASETYRPGDQAPATSRIADAARDGTS